MLIKTGYSKILHGCDYLCFNLLTHALSLKITLGNIPLVGIIEHSVDILITETQFIRNLLPWNWRVCME